jgi:TolB protein
MVTRQPQSTRTRLTISLVFGLVALLRVAPAHAGQGGQIVFQSTVDDNTDIYVMDEDGTDVRRLTEDPGYDGQPRWSPGGKRIVFVSYRGDVRNIYLMDADGGNLRRLTDNPEFVWAPAWSPDGQRIAFYATYEAYGIHIMDSDGRNVRFLTDAPDVPGHPGNHFQREYGLDWSPDGTTILFNTHTSDTFGHIWAIDPDGQNARNLSDDGVDTCLAWSPDGKRILFEAHEQDHGIYTMRPDGRGRREVLVPAEGACPRWSPDGREIVFWMDGDLHIMSDTGKNLRRLVRLPGAGRVPDWFDPAHARAVRPSGKTPITWSRLKQPTG